ncbi:CsbD family protein [Alloalcanivorax gelatiniphagus]|uniref:CsbD family protein n=1 Tax=Alloalcanivorax gelatiniphagus TaxID=1194167 RepID=A0ABY2XFN7_9GAMM|nr:CsbD family protein [Alloalcanivorax gelatiniphagus]TMW10412.1 CsbD family protein [Alloalcanivorax gelatiniphagus]|tara:strand:+ start:9292 stop:9492 length:201 start_codon:yes stop_codon:yes gene_type:complete
MNSDTLKGKWKQMMGDAKKNWGKLTDDDLKQIEGRKDKLVGKIQERYGSTREDAERQADEWLGKHG